MEIKTFGPDSGITGYWGPPTSSIDWCEANYVVSYYIAEFWNTLSSFLMAFYGIIGLAVTLRYQHEWRTCATHISVIVIGVGSAYFHGTLLYIGQMWDEIPMVWGVLTWLYILWQIDEPFGKGSIPLAIGLSLYGLVAAAIHYAGAYTVAFQAHFGLLTGIATAKMFYYRWKHGTSEYDYMPIYFCLGFGIAFFFWLCDQFFCHQLHNLSYNPQLHAVWHVCNAMNIHHGVQYTTFLRMRRLQMKPKGAFPLLGNLPFFYPTSDPITPKDRDV